jgi:phosphocarrier protein HPr
VSPSSESGTARSHPVTGDGAGTTAEATVTLPANLHARPAGRLARTAARFTSAIQVCCGERTAGPTGVLAVMALGATAGAVVTVRAEGPDAEAAVRALADVLSTAE